MKAMTANVKRVASCEGKKRFETFSRAAKTAHRQAQHKTGKYMAYACQYCGGFHVGTHIASDLSRPGSHFDGRQQFAVYAADAEGRESLIGFAATSDGGRVAELISAEPGWFITRIVERRRRAA